MFLCLGALTGPGEFCQILGGEGRGGGSPRGILGETQMFSFVTSCGFFRHEGEKMGEFMSADKHREKSRGQFPEI